MRSSEKIAVNEFSPEQAGSRVGWTSVEAKEINDNPLVFVDVVVATVGEDGAKLSYHEMNDDGEVHIGVSNSCAEGFVAVAGLQTIISRERGLSTDSANVRFTDNNDRHGADSGASILLSGAWPGQYQPEIGSVKWANGSQEILDDLKDGLLSEGVSEHYRTLYYLLNGYLWIQQEGEERKPELLLPDISMQDDTLDQVADALVIKSVLEAAITEDEVMKQNLTVFSKIPASKIPKVFKNSRVEMRRKEAKMSIVNDTLAVGSIVYTPTSVFRTWPYMDAAAQTDKEAFGLELEALENGSIDRVQSELTDEIKSLHRRLEFAQIGYEGLLALASSERAS